MNIMMLGNNSNDIIRKINVKYTSSSNLFSYKVFQSEKFIITDKNNKNPIKPYKIPSKAIIMEPTRSGMHNKTSMLGISSHIDILKFSVA